MESARYPQIRVSTRSTNPLALIAAVRQELRHRGVDSREIGRFSDQAMAAAHDLPHVHRVCNAWVTTLAP